MMVPFSVGIFLVLDPILISELLRIKLRQDFVWKFQVVRQQFKYSNPLVFGMVLKISLIILMVVSLVQLDSYHLR